MAVDFTDLTAIADLLKNVYGEGIAKQFVDERTLYNLLTKSDIVPGGNGYVFPIQYARAMGTGARKESELLPPPLVGKYDQCTITPRYVYGAIRISGPAIYAARGNLMSFVNSLSHQVDDAYQSVVNDLSRMVWGDSFGLIATLSAVSDAVTTSGTTTWTITADNDLGVQRCVEGMIVDFFQSTAIDQSSVGSRISSVNPSAKTCEMEPNDGTYKAYHPITAAQSYTITTGTVASASYMVAMGAREASHATTNASRETMGMEGIFDDGTLLASFQGITVSTYPRWKANILGNSDVNRELSIDLMLHACDATRARSGKRVEEMYMGLGQRRKYANLLSPDVRFEAGKLRGGYEVLTFAAGDGTVELIIAPEAPPNKIFCAPKGAVQKFELAELGWGDLDQQMHQRAGYDEWDQFLRVYTNLGVEMRNCLTLIDDLVEPTKSY